MTWTHPHPAQPADGPGLQRPGGGGADPLVHAYGAKIFAQLHHGGATSKSAFTGRQNLSQRCPHGARGEVPREMTLEDIKRVQEKFIAAAIRCKKAGYDGVELHGAHSYLIAQFFSKYYNRRTDAYGGSLENRCRFIDEIIAGIRAKLGRYPISVRICGDEMTDEPGFSRWRTAWRSAVTWRSRASTHQHFQWRSGTATPTRALLPHPGWSRPRPSGGAVHSRHRPNTIKTRFRQSLLEGVSDFRLPQPVRGPGVHEQGAGRPRASVSASAHARRERLAGQRHAG
ncbi:MAG: hypothetical protein ACLTYN_04620 [Dysosmobacter welbionis]